MPGSVTSSGRCIPSAFASSPSVLIAPRPCFIIVGIVNERIAVIMDPSGESADGEKLLLEFGDMCAHNLGCALAVASSHTGDDLAVFFDRLAQALHPVERDIPQAQRMVVEPFERLLEE